MEETKKIYGTSVLDQTEEKDPESPANPIDYSDDEIASMRAELKETGTEGRVTAKVSTDALSGIKVSSVVDEDKFASLDKLDKDLEEKDIRGKRLPEHGAIMIKDLTGVEINDADSERFATYFENHDENNKDDKNFAADSIDVIYTVLGAEIMEFIKALSETSEEIESVARRLLNQIHSVYEAAVEYNDDMRELSQLTRKVKLAAEKYDELKKSNNDDPEVHEETLDNLIQTQNWITRYMEVRNKLDDRNKRLKQDYSIDDIDARTLSDVKVALEDALEMKTIMSYMTTTAKNLYKEYWNERDRHSVIKNWVSYIKNDSETLYTFPTNDYYNVGRTISDVIEFIFNALLAEQFKDHPLPANLDIPLAKYYVQNNICKQSEINAVQDKATMILYILAKTFKYKKLGDVYNRRVLSYTLDMMSKLGKNEYRAKFFELGNVVYHYLSK